MAAKHNCLATLLLAGLLAGGCGRTTSVAPPSQPAAQNAPPPTSEDVFKQTINYDAPYFTLKKLEIRGKTDSSALTENGLLIKDFEIYTYRLVTNDPAHVTNALEMIVSAPECLFNRNEASGSSGGPLTAQTADGRFLIQGTGFLWQQKGTNAALTISNNVFTTVKNDLLTAGGSAPVTTETGGRFIYIHSDSFRFDRNANLITYRDHVHAQDEQLDLTCDTINIRRSTNGPISELVADGNIAVVDNITHGRTTGEHAVYSDTGGGQLVTLTGNPYWQNGPQEATAQAFIFNRSLHTFSAQGGAHFKLPASSISSSGFLLAPQTGADENATVVMTNLVDVYAGVITMQLPATTNGPLQGVTAETNVVIVDPDHHSQATGDCAVYTAADGLLVLSGKAQWQSDEGTARAEVLTFDRTNLAFAALTNAYLKLPLSALNKSPAFGNFAARNSETANRFLEVTSDSYDYRGDMLTFHQNVHAGLLEGETPLGTLESGTLTAGFLHTNVLKNLVADSNVHLRQPPTLTPDGKTVESDFTCDRVEIQMRTNGSLESAVATGRALATRTETSPRSASPIHLTLASDTVNASFMPDTNAIQTLVADHNVVMTRDEDKATGDKVVYTATNDTAVLTGHPRLERSYADITADDAIIYELGQGTLRARGHPQAVLKFPAGGLSQASLPSLPGQNPK
ncbi:MAG TPA: LptA/OstA family protein [Verrucomicrobiae bacterium]|nr:LptA/OstA family protein [Verrucomicrobiae bacterium]